MNNSTKLALAFGTSLISFTAFAQTPVKESLRAIREAGSEVMGKGMAQPNYDLDSVVSKSHLATKAKALEELKKVDKAGINPKEAYDYAVMYNMAEDYASAKELAQVALSATQDPKVKFNIEAFIISNAGEAGDADTLYKSISEMQPTTSDGSRSQMGFATRYAPSIADKIGCEATIDFIDKIYASTVYDDPTTYAKNHLEGEKHRLLESQKSRSDKTPIPSDAEILRTLETSAKLGKVTYDYEYVSTKATLLNQSGKKAEALNLFDNFIKTIPPEMPDKDAGYMKSSRNQLALMNTPETEISYSNKLGDFTSLKELKGKVVIIDAFAHWCGPCKMAFPSLRELYADLKDKGLEVVGITGYYGFYDKEQGLDQAAEYARMIDFKKEHQMTWPILFTGTKANNPVFKAYAVSGIPHVVLIDRKGIIRDFHIGYGLDSAKQLRKEVEKLLAE